DQKWGADISYIWTREGWLYLAVASHLVLPSAVDLVRTMAPDWTDPNAAAVSSSQPSFPRCCDDHLNPP
ncbi:MAG TPA: hypothetical protein VKG83_12460, partial [Mycobacterium sp.]|nr:hypothetical protein [Mycobacterium sp.]